MGLDTTFHAISENELHRYVYDVLNDPSITSRIAKEISSDKEKSERIENAVYLDSLISWSNNGVDSDGDPITSMNFSNTISFAIAILAGYLHPFWYSRDGALTLARSDHPIITDFFTSYSDIKNSPLQKFNASEAKLLNGNYSASGIVKDVKKLKQWIVENDEYLSARFEEDGLDSLHRAVDYCIENNLLFIEAADVVIPFTNQCFSDFDNFKAHFLNKL